MSAIPSATRYEMRRIVDACPGTGIEFKVVPSMRELIQGKARVTELRSVRVAHLREDCITGPCQLVPECVSPLRERGKERAALR